MPTGDNMKLPQVAMAYKSSRTGEYEVTLVVPYFFGQIDAIVLREAGEYALLAPPLDVFDLQAAYILNQEAAVWASACCEPEDRWTWAKVGMCFSQAPDDYLGHVIMLLEAE